MGTILLFYKYESINDPALLRDAQKVLCSSLNLRGRILIAQEGINGTLGGNDDEIASYINEMRKDPRFSDIDFKTSAGDASYFANLYIAVKAEIVRLGIDPKKLSPKQGGTHLSPDQVHKLIASKPSDLVILDCRNEYESRIGTFTGSLTPPIQNFRELPAYIDEHIEQFRDKKVLTHCTGGIRCERASAYLKEKGVAQEVYQIQGGIHRYAEQYPDGFFRGKNYVFDDRIALTVNDDILATCIRCSLPYDTYTNCINTRCNQHIIICEDCLKTTARTCSDTCKELIADGKVAVRTKFRNHP